MRSTPIVLVLAFAMAGCVGTDSDQGPDQASDGAGAADPTPDAADPTPDADGTDAGDAPLSGSVPVEHSVSVDIAVQFHVFYIGDNRCASEFVKVDGPIVNVNLTATWEYSVPVVPSNLELRVFNGTDGEAGGHAGWPQGVAIAHAEGDSPLTLDADVAAGNQIRLVVCDWSDVVVREAFDVHIEGSLRYLPQTPAAT